MPNFTDTLPALGDLSVPFAPTPVAGFDDAALLAAQQALGELRRRVDAQAAVVAGEIAHRSRRELSHSGLAASRGQRSVEGLISTLTGGSTRDARTLVKAGEVMPTPAPRPSAPPVPAWLGVVGEAVASASISVAAADVIRSRLGSTQVARDLAAAAAGDEDAAPSADAVQALTDAARDLVGRAPQLTIEQLIVKAGQARDELDLAGVAAREREQHERRFLRLTPLPDGMVRLTGLLDRESAAIVVPHVDAITNPRRNGPRFTAADAEPAIDEVVRESRTPEQFVLDAFVELIRLGGGVDDGTILGDKKPAVRILVTARDLDVTPDADGIRPGVAYFEGQTEPVSINTAKRYICSSGAVPILFDGDGRVLNLGREQRLFSEKQRLAMAARDGGCLMCDRPPSWTEAHHIDHWDEHGGRTDIDDGVLLCRFCHLLLHNRGWRIRREGGTYFLEHPGDEGILRRTPLPSRSPAHDRLRPTA